MRHVRGDAERVDAGLAHAQLEQRRDAARDAHLAPVDRVGLDQLTARGVRGHGHRTRVRDGHRDGLQGHERGDAEPLHEQPDGGHEPLPGVVRLGAVQQQERLAAVVLDRVEQDLRRGEGLVPVAAEGHPWSVRPVVDQAVGVEAREHLVRQVGEQVRAGQRTGMGGVEVPGQVVHEHEAAALAGFADGGLLGQEALRLGEQFEQLLRSLGHHGRSSSKQRTCSVRCSPGDGAGIPSRPPGRQRDGSSLAGRSAGAVAGSRLSSAPERSPSIFARVPSSSTSGDWLSSSSRMYR